MIINRTFSILKPDVVRRNLTGKVNALIEENGFVIIAQKMVKISLIEAKGFYIVHKDRPFFAELTEYLSSYPIVIQVLKKDNAVVDFRKLIGATDPVNADKGTIRYLYGISVGENSVHGSDSIENADIEIQYFFNDNEICDR